MQVETDHLGGRGERSAVLVTTGSFSPIHRGHIAMMTAAKAAVETTGWSVRGGYVSPSHDNYVSGKYGGAAAMAAEHRIELVRRALAPTSWLAVDEWEAARSRSVGHHRVIERLTKADLADRVYYVCGADRVEFVFSSIRRKHCCVCVERGGSPVDEYRSISDGDRILFAESTRYAHASSSAIRAGNHDQLPVGLEEVYATVRSVRSPRRLPKLVD